MAWRCTAAVLFPSLGICEASVCATLFVQSFVSTHYFLQARRARAPCCRACHQPSQVFAQASAQCVGCAWFSQRLHRGRGASVELTKRVTPNDGCRLARSQQVRHGFVLLRQRQQRRVVEEAADGHVLGHALAAAGLDHELAPALSSLFHSPAARGRRATGALAKQLVGCTPCPALAWRHAPLPLPPTADPRVSSKLVSRGSASRAAQACVAACRRRSGPCSGRSTPWRSRRATQT